MYIRRLKSGKFGVFLESGVRIAVTRTRQEAERYRDRMRKEGK